MRKRLTDESVMEATGDRKKQQVFIWDSGAAGLGLRVTSRGKKAWVYRYSLGGHEKRVTVGTWPKLDLTAARQRVAELQAQVDHGEHPRLEGCEAEIGEGGAPGGPKTLADLWRQLQAKHLPRRSRGHQRNVKDAFERLILPRLGGATPLAALTWEQVDDWHRGLESTPTQANRALAAVRKAVNEAKKWGWLDRGLPNPAADHEMHRETRGGKPFSDAELHRVGVAIAAEPAPLIRAALTVYFLSGLRPGEVCRLRWSNLEEGGVTLLEETKTGPRAAVLSTRAEAVIRSLPRLGGYVFPGRKDGQPLGGEKTTHGLANAWKRIAKRAQLTNGRRLYDARHTWISTAAALGIGDDVRRVLAGHVAARGSAHGIYLHAVPALRVAADQVAERLAEALGLDQLGQPEDPP